MKKIFFVMMTAMFLTGCGVQRLRAVEKNYFDYSVYTDAGFFLSPNQYVGEHQPIGELFIKVTPAVVPANQAQKEKEVPKNRNYSDGIYSNQPSFGMVKVENIDSAELIEMAVAEAVSRGANGISNFDVKVVYSTKVTKYGSTTELSHYEISGLCIKTH